MVQVWVRVYGCGCGGHGCRYGYDAVTVRAPYLRIQVQYRHGTGTIRVLAYLSKPLSKTPSAPHVMNPIENIVVIDFLVT